ANTAKIMARGLKPARGWIVIGHHYGRAAGDPERVVEAVISIGQPCCSGDIPDVSSGRLGDVGHGGWAAWKGGGQKVPIGSRSRKAAGQVVVILTFEVVISASIAVEIGNVLDHVLIGHSLGAPRPAITADLAAYVEVVKQHKPLGQCVLVWGHVVSKQH